MLTIILITFPLLFQIIAGRKAIGETISLKFGTVSILSILFQIVLSIIAFYITLSNFSENTAGTPYRCGMGILGIVMLELLLTIILIITIVIQYFIKRSYEK